MASRVQKQIFYGIFYLALFAILYSIFYILFLKPAPTCSDNIQNQSEQGIDCGGPCAKICIPQSVKQISVNFSLFFVLGNSHVSLLAKVTNLNQDYASRNFAYKFSLYDSSGAAIQSFSGESFIYAGEAGKYILLPNVSLSGASGAKISRADFKIQDSGWVPASDFRGPPALAISGTNTNASGTGIAVGGYVTNKDTVEFGRVTVVAVFYGKLGQPTGASETELDNLSPNELRTFSIVNPPIADVDISKTEFRAYGLRR